MRLLLLSPANSADDAGCWPHGFDEIVTASREELGTRYTALLPVEAGTGPVPVIASANLALICTELEALDRLVAAAPNCDVIFAPSALTRLDWHRRQRDTLVAARAVAIGTVLGEDDLGTEAGGRGATAELHTAMLGRRVLYDLAAGEPIDFGVVEEDEGREP